MVPSVNRNLRVRGSRGPACQEAHMRKTVFATACLLLLTAAVTLVGQQQGA